MASDWLKMEYDLAEKPEVIAMSGILKVEPDLIVGKLHRVWSWFARHTTNGNAVGVTKTFIDVRACRKGFADAMSKVGWMTVSKGGISVPNFDRHMSKSAKARALGAERMQRYRNDQSVTEALPEKEGESLVPVTKAQALDAAALSGMNWNEVIADCREVCQSLKPQKPEDRSLVIKSVVISRIMFDRDWLWNAVKKAKRKPERSQYPYLHGALKGKCKDAGQDFNMLLSQVEVPDEILNPPQRSMNGAP